MSQCWDVGCRGRGAGGGFCLGRGGEGGRGDNSCLRYLFLFKCVKTALAELKSSFINK